MKTLYISHFITSQVSVSPRLSACHQSATSRVGGNVSMKVSVATFARMNHRLNEHRSRPKLVLVNQDSN